MDSGIYKIVNILDGKIYLGSSSRLNKRKYEHFRDLNLSKHCNTHLQNSYNKYGRDCFKWEVVEYVDFNEDVKVFRKNLLDREQFYLDLFKAYKHDKGYNIDSIAGSRLGSKASEETKKKMRDSRLISMTYERRIAISNRLKGHVVSEETKRKIGAKNKGKTNSEETRRKLSLALRGRIRTPLSEETKRKIGEANSISNKGKVLTEETRKKISESNKGRKVFKETREKIGISHKGKKITKEHSDKLKVINSNRIWTFEQRQKVSEFHKGRVKSDSEIKHLSESKIGENHHFYGKELSEEHRKKIGKSVKGRIHSEDTKRKIGESNKGNTNFKGRTHSEEAKRRIKEANSKKVKNTTTGEIFESITEACYKYGLATSNVSKACKGKYKKCGGFEWCYIP